MPNMGSVTRRFLCQKQKLNNILTRNCNDDKDTIVFKQFDLEHNNLLFSICEPAIHKEIFFYGIKVVKGFYNFVFIAFIVCLNFRCVLIQTSQAISFIQMFALHMNFILRIELIDNFMLTKENVIFIMKLNLNILN